jgi:hypothetical protein
MEFHRCAVGSPTRLGVFPGSFEQMAKAGTVLITAETLRLAEGYVQVKPLGPVAVKGLAEAIANQWSRIFFSAALRRA